MDYLKKTNLTDVASNISAALLPPKNPQLINQHIKPPGYENYQQFYESLREITGLYLFPFISIFGTIGNIFVIIVYAKSKIYSTSFFLIALSISDILKLLNDLVYFLVMFISKFDEVYGHYLYLLLYSYTHYIFVFTALNTSWLICTIAIDRYLTVVKQFYINQTKVVLSILIIFIAAVLFAIPSPLFHKQKTTYNLITNTTSTDIVVSELGMSEFKRYYQFINGMIKSVLPVFLLIYLNYRILRVVYKNRIKDKTRKKGAKSNSRITLMLVTIVVTFVICVLPDSIMSMMQLGYANEGYFVRGLREITDLLMALNCTSTFPICLYFSMEFRTKFKELFISEGLQNRANAYLHKREDNRAKTFKLISKSSSHVPENKGPVKSEEGLAETLIKNPALNEIEETRIN